jgi:Tol biopolymer transport system component
MKQLLQLALLASALLVPALPGCSSSTTTTMSSPASHGDPLVWPGESSVLSNIRKLTFAGENAEGYFSFDETRFVFQRSVAGVGNSCDQIYSYDVASGYTRLISTGTGRTTCSYFLPGDSLVLYASTHGASPDCPAPPDQSKGYVWPLYAEYDIALADTGGHFLRWLTKEPGYDAEATVSPTGDRIVFTSTRTGDIELFSMKLDGSDMKQLTNVPGYDGGAFYSWDGKKIVFRASRPEGKELDSYRGLLRENLVRPSRMELYVMNADGTGMRQITHNGAANFAPFWHPDGKHIIFASNVGDPRGRNFDLYLIDESGENMRQLTTNPTFDGFPMFTRDGRTLIFASNRNGMTEGETDLFLASFRLPQ